MTLFAMLARRRQARAMHPRGIALAGEWRTTADSPLAGLVGDRVEVLARMSKSAGMPGAWPDVLGLAVRLRLESPVDFLFSTVGPLRLPCPRTGWGSGRYDSIMPYRTPAGLLWFAAFTEPGLRVPSSLDALHHHARDGLRLVVAASGLVGPKAPVAVLSLRPAPHEPAWFDPVAHHHPRLRPAPRALAAVRERAYADSRRGRGVRES